MPGNTEMRLMLMMVNLQRLLKYVIFLQQLGSPHTDTKKADGSFHPGLGFSQEDEKTTGVNGLWYFGKCD